jgi:ribonucleoside-diphosphate reductase beta chain
MSVFPLKKQIPNESTMFFGEKVNIARYDKVKYPQFDKLTEKQQGFFWRPQEIDCTKDIKDFKSLTPQQKHIFTSNLKRQILLDSVQGRAPCEAFLSICSLPEIENWIIAWSFFETIHSRSYTHIIRNVYSDPSKVFDEMLEIKEIAECAKDISKYYDALIEENNSSKLIGTYNYAAMNYGGTYNHKKALWLCLNAVNALEGIRFYVSFACSWAFAEVKKMEGNAKIIKLIARDENLHLASTQNLIKLLPKDDPDFAQIKVECAAEVEKIFADVINQEKAWARYLFKDGAIIGLNEKLLCDYVDFIADKRMKTAGVTSTIKINANPLPWTQKWIAGFDVQVAPQETEITSYVSGGVKQDVDASTFKGFSL